MMKQITSLQECKERFVKFGECEHHYKEWIKPFGQLSKFLTCQVCAKQFEKKYPSQAETIKTELLLALNGGIKDKQIIYNIVVQKTDLPRPTVRRVARDLRNDLLKKVEILSEKRSHNIATDYD